jgi:hypothetical protein
VHARGQHRLQFAAKLRGVGARPDPQIDPVQPPEARQLPLRRGHVHDAQALAVGSLGQQARDLQRDGRGADDYLQLVAGLEPQPLSGRRREQYRVGVEQIEDHARTLGQQPGLHLGGTQWVESEHAQALLAPRDRYVRLHGRIGRRDLRHARDARIDGLVESRTRAPHYQVGFPREVPRSDLEFVQGAGVDEMHRDAERDSQRDRGDGEDRPAGMLAQRSEDERVEQQKPVTGHGWPLTSRGGPRPSGSARDRRWPPRAGSA